MTDDKMRQKFEAFCKSRHIKPLDTDITGAYTDTSVSLLWHGWQASRAAMVPMTDLDIARVWFARTGGEITLAELTRIIRAVEAHQAGGEDMSRTVCGECWLPYGDDGKCGCVQEQDMRDENDPEYLRGYIEAQKESFREVAAANVALQAEVEALRKAIDVDAIMVLADEYARASSYATFTYERGGGHSGDKDVAEARAALLEALK